MAQPPDADDAEKGGKKPKRKWSLRQLIIAAACGLLLVVSTLFLILPKAPDPPGDRLRWALKLLDEKQDRPAEEIAEKLIAEDYRDPDFPGGAPFVMGVTAFRQAERADSDSKEAQYLVAINFLRDAENLSVEKSRRAEWAYALGLALHRVGSEEESIPVLEEAVKAYPPGKVEATLRLTEAYLDGRNAEQIASALPLNTDLLAIPDLPLQPRTHAKLQRAQILFAMGKRAEGDAVLATVAQDKLGNLGGVILRAQTLIVEGKYREAMQLLEPVASNDRLDRTYARQALYLIGVCAYQLKQLEDAVGYFERAAERFERTHESLASRLWAADALRQLGRNEEALEAYGLVLRQIRQPKKFRNRWLSLTRVRELVIDAWNGWIDRHYFAGAIALSEMMSPAIPLDEAHEFSARAAGEWAKSVEKEVQALPIVSRELRLNELKLRQRAAGDAYAQLAESRRTSTAYSDSVWTSAEYYLKAGESHLAITELTRFIEAGQSSRVPMAIVMRAEAQLDLGHSDLALKDFELVVKQAPTDPAAFQARFQIGQVYWEENQPDQAEVIWRGILQSPDLTPNALEWRKSLRAIGQLLFETADQKLRQLEMTAGTQQSSEQQQALTQVYSRLGEAVLRLQEYLERYPDSAECTETRYLLARSLQRQARYPELRLQAAETESARTEFRKQVDALLDRAVTELSMTQVKLLEQQAAGQLNKVGLVMLRNCHFELGHCQFALGRYPQAIEAYTKSVGRYQQDPETLGAYVQIANCYERLKRPSEALSTLAQAQLVLKQLPDTAFVNEAGRMSRKEWERWPAWAIKRYE